VQCVLRYTKGDGSSIKDLTNHLKSKHKNYIGTGRDSITKYEKKVMSLLGLQRRGQITSKIVSCLTYKEAHISENQRGLFVPQDYLPLNSETD